MRLLLIFLWLFLSVGRVDGQELLTPIGTVPFAPIDIALNDAISSVSYDSVNDIFVATTAHTTLLDRANGNTILANDLTGTLVVSVSIGEAGQLFGGGFVWRGGSITLGIPDETVLMSGNVVLFALNPFITSPQLVFQLDIVNPSLQPVVGDLKSVLWRGFMTPNVCLIQSGEGGPFSCDWTDKQPSVSTTFDLSLTNYLSIDSDADIVRDEVDNCTGIPNYQQTDSDNDDFGNICDGDFNQDCLVNFLDFSEFSGSFLGNNPVYDLNSDGAVNFVDLSILANYFLSEPGPASFETCSIPEVRETFDNGIGNWELNQNIQLLSGSLQYASQILIDNDKLELPSPFLGDWSGFAENHVLVFDHQMESLVGEGKPLKLRIFGFLGTATWTGPLIDGPYEWSRIEVPLTEEHFETEGIPLEAIFDSVPGVTIDMSGSVDGTSVTRIDNISIRRIP